MLVGTNESALQLKATRERRSCVDRRDETSRLRILCTDDVVRFMKYGYNFRICLPELGYTQLLRPFARRPGTSQRRRVLVFPVSFDE